MQHQLTRWKLEYRAAELSQQVWNGANNRPLEDSLAISQAEKTIQKAAERTCVRPALPAPPFAQLHRVYAVASLARCSSLRVGAKR